MQTRTPIKVRGYHLDLYSHVNNARYLEFLEEGRWNFLEQQPGIEELMKSGLGMAVVNININFRRGAFMNEELEVLTELTKVGNKSALIQQKIQLKGTDTLIADADVTFVVTDQKAQKAVPFEGELLKLLQAWQKKPE
ncbi:acyl-CoA thioesterase [Marinospirillum insulare]|uniref:Thioesterase n=1 Tax=Marinospirillum insulare TaxID=217169 RepID=A0ABQ5ZVV7_9GAMM|nr:thioesterase family protein [Marinospirillum insulare]GLR64299.1 thioesterase [Marinospirillum insulare]